MKVDWSDSRMRDLSPFEKCLLVYLMTNEQMNDYGVYRVSLDKAASRVGLYRGVIKNMLQDGLGELCYYVDGWVYLRCLEDPDRESFVEDVPPEIKHEILEIENELGDRDFVDLFQLDEEKIEEEKQEKERERAQLKENTSKVASHYCDKINENSRLTKKARNKIKTRLKEYSVDELKEAINKFSNNDWRMKNNSDNGMSWFFRSEHQVAKWLQLEETKSSKSVQI